MVLGEAGAPRPEDNPIKVRVEFTSPNDLFFHYTHEVDHTAFYHLKSE